ncbi:dihydroorotase [Zoogloea dura]|uniref:Dihydroorotase n=1 Tax=Zoogloea dura TaxID=2728840 RepID=A0A848G4B0_9RHOO|nr:dihydroorotase [Zoogloea dura]NML24521.1 dihydroorotase [Zoogloea dura]
MQARLLIRNARLVNEGRITTGDLLVADGRIDRIAPAIDTCADTEIDAAGAWLLPGMIDDQVHFREPGLTHKGCIASESAAAVAGGITSFMDMPNTRPPTLDMAAVAAKRHLAAASSHANFAFHLGVSTDNLDAVARADPRLIAGVKVFMGASTGNMLVDDPMVLERLFASVPTLLLAHCEHSQTITANEAEWRRQHGDAIPFAAHPLIRSAEACLRSTTLAVDLARRHGTRLHVLHLSTARELALFEPGPVTGKQITAEACVHHLYFDDEDYEALGSHLKCNPAVKSRDDRVALRHAVATGRIDVIGTDHAPHTLAEKAAPYSLAPAGLPLAQHALPALLELVHDGLLDLPTLVARCSHGVAELFRIRERGYLREGYWADLALVDDGHFAVEAAPILSRCGWTPFAGRHFRSRVRSTVVSGRLAWHRGCLMQGCRGLPLEFTR